MNQCAEVDSLASITVLEGICKRAQVVVSLPTMSFDGATSTMAAPWTLSTLLQATITATSDLPGPTGTNVKADNSTWMSKQGRVGIAVGVCVGVAFFAGIIWLFWGRNRQRMFRRGRRTCNVSPPSMIMTRHGPVRLPAPAPFLC